MNKLIIEANLTDGQISTIAEWLGYKEEIVDWDKTTELEPTSEIDYDTGEEKLTPNFLIEPNVIPNPQSDDEFVRNHFERMITETASDIFARETISELNRQRDEAVAGISSQISWAITSKKQ